VSSGQAAYFLSGSRRLSVLLLAPFSLASDFGGMALAVLILMTLSRLLAKSDAPLTPE
jgi:hypothetical protein